MVGHLANTSKLTAYTFPHDGLIPYTIRLPGTLTRARHAARCHVMLELSAASRHFAQLREILTPRLHALETLQERLAPSAVTYPTLHPCNTKQQAYLPGS